MLSHPKVSATPRAPSAYAALRTTLPVSRDLDDLVVRFGAAIAEDGIDGHLCLIAGGAETHILFGDSPALRDMVNGCDILATAGGPRLRLSRRPEDAAFARVRGFATLYLARALLLIEAGRTPITQTGLTLCERFILGRLLAGDCLLDIAVALDRSVACVQEMLARASDSLGAHSREEAIAIAARQGWLLSTLPHFPALSPGDISYYS